jgi:microcompartment protein CcmL/EutN
LELDSVALGYRVVDAMVKQSPIDILEANLVEPGKFLVLFSGGVAEVQEAWARGREIGGDSVVDQLLLPMVHQAIVPGLQGEQCQGYPDTIGVVEGRSIASLLSACDRSLKNAEVQLTGLRITPALGGRAFFVVQGLQHDVEAALEVAKAPLAAADKLHRIEIIPRPHLEFLAVLLRPAPFRLDPGS